MSLWFDDDDDDDINIESRSVVMIVLVMEQNDDKHNGDTIVEDDLDLNLDDDLDEDIVEEDNDDDDLFEAITGWRSGTASANKNDNNDNGWEEIDDVKTEYDGVVMVMIIWMKESIMVAVMTIFVIDDDVTITTREVLLLWKLRLSGDEV